MDNPTIITLDLTNRKGYELHTRIKEAFNFPDYYGENWDAFRDLIRGVGEYTIVEIKGLKSLPKDLQPSGEMMISILQENKEYQEEFMKKCPQFDYRFEYRIID